MIKTIVAGAGGRMGGRIIQLIRESPDMILSGALEKEGHPAVGRDLGEWLGLGKLNLPIVSELEKLIPARGGHHRFHLSFRFDGTFASGRRRPNADGDRQHRLYHR